MILLSVDLRGTTATARVCEVRAWPTRKSRPRDCRLVTSGRSGSRVRSLNGDSSIPSWRISERLMVTGRQTVVDELLDKYTTATGIGPVSK